MVQLILRAEQKSTNSCVGILVHNLPILDDHQAYHVVGHDSSDDAEVGASGTVKICAEVTHPGVQITGGISVGTPRIRIINLVFLQIGQ